MVYVILFLSNSESGQRHILATPPSSQVPSALGYDDVDYELYVASILPYIQPREALHSNKHTFKCNVGTRTNV